MSANYNGMTFKTPLEARWAAFFDLAGWSWKVNPASVGNWSPDFFLEFPCDHSECGGSDTLLASVLPLESIEAFGAHPCTKYAYGVPRGEPADRRNRANGSAAFGIDPSVTRWVISHGSGGGTEDLHFRVSNADDLWAQAGKLVG